MRHGEVERRRGIGDINKEEGAEAGSGEIVYKETNAGKGIITSPLFGITARTWTI